jgi:hypothetical protein
MGVSLSATPLQLSLLLQYSGIHPHFVQHPFGVASHLTRYLSGQGSATSSYINLDSVLFFSFVLQVFKKYNCSAVFVDAAIGLAAEYIIQDIPIKLQTKSHRLT